MASPAMLLPSSTADVGGEAALLPYLIRWLVQTGRIRDRTRVAYELPWMGRRVDLAVLTGRGRASAFELKLGSLQRALEQAAYNASSFHRSWVVTGNLPRAEGLHWAEQAGVGIIVVQPPSVVLIRLPDHRTPHASVASRLRTTIAGRAHVHGFV